MSPGVSPEEVAALVAGGWQEQHRRRIAEIEARVGTRGELLLFGAGYLGRHALQELKQSAFRPAAFVDNGERLWGEDVDGLPVLSPHDAQVRYGDDAVWLITVYTNSAVVDQCRSLGVAWITCAEFAWLHPDIDVPSLDFGNPEALANSASEIVAARDVWADAESQLEYLAQVKWRFTLDYDALEAPRPVSETYFPTDVFRRRDDEVFVDCGAFTGDTLEAFLEASGGHFAFVTAVEPDPVNAAALRERIAAWERAGIGPMVVEQSAAGSHPHEMPFAATGTAGSSVGAGADFVRVRPLDEVLVDQAPTFIKFDVEGAERDALLGARETIARHAPVLAICLYHKPADVWDLPLLVRDLNPAYSLYLRRYSDERWETVCYAVPDDRRMA
jgi:FkbM family methyltransferase